MKLKSTMIWVLRLIVSVILLQTLFFKFTAHPDSVYIFSQLKAEPFGRIALGVIELIVSLLVVIPRTSVLGMIFAFLIMLGAVAAHLFVLGLDVMEDGGALFALALIVMFCALLGIFVEKKEIKAMQEKFGIKLF